MPRGRSPNVATNPYSWQNATYNYLKHYQEELIKQYSQSLNLSQLTQLSQYFNQNQYANAFNQFLAQQNPILSNANLLKQMSSSQFLATQMADANKSSYKKKTDQPPVNTSGLNLDQLKSYGGLEISSKTAGYKKHLPQTITSAAQAATITKVKPTVPYNVPSNQPINLGSKKPLTKESTITHSVTSMSHVTATCKTKSIYTPSAFKSIYTGNTSFTSADLTKISKPSAVTKTTASSQIFKVS